MEQRLTTPLARAFRQDEGGAVTVDWVVLCAAVCALGLATMDVLDPPLTNMAEAVEGEVQQTDTTDGSGSYRPFDPDTWEARLTQARAEWSVTTTEVVVAYDAGYDDDNDDDDNSNGTGFGVGELPPGYRKKADGTIVKTVTTGPTESEMRDEMAGFITDDGHKVKIGKEDKYAALQMVLEENGYTTEDGWPDYRTY